MKTAICSCPDTGPLESLVVLLGSAGYECLILSGELAGYLHSLGCTHVKTAVHVQGKEGTEPHLPLRKARRDDLKTCDLFVDVKAHREAHKVWSVFPRLRERTLWYRINGGKPEHLIRNGVDMGNEVNPPCPVLTPNQWYKGLFADARAYTCWPPFYRFDDYYQTHGREGSYYNSPICLIHNPVGWGFGNYVEKAKRVGVQTYGIGSDLGIVKHHLVPRMLSAALAMVHLKQNDAPGYALYEALAAACPLVVSERLVEMSRMHDLFEDGVTCLYFEKPGLERIFGAGPSPEEVDEAIKGIEKCLQRLSDPAENARIGLAGHNRLKELMWNERKEEDGRGFQEWMGRHFP